MGMKLIKNRFFPIALLLVIFAAGIYLAYVYSSSNTASRSEVVVGEELPESSKTTVATYIRDNISVLSPEPEVLGGKFYVTNITFASASKALVEYEDGHNAFKAEVEFFFDKPDLVKILNFKVLQRN